MLILNLLILLFVPFLMAGVIKKTKAFYFKFKKQGKKKICEKTL